MCSSCSSDEPFDGGDGSEAKLIGPESTQIEVDKGLLADLMSGETSKTYIMKAEESYIFSSEYDSKWGEDFLKNSYGGPTLHFMPEEIIIHDGMLWLDARSICAYGYYYHEELEAAWSSFCKDTRKDNYLDGCYIVAPVAEKSWPGFGYDYEAVPLKITDSELIVMYTGDFSANIGWTLVKRIIVTYEAVDKSEQPSANLVFSSFKERDKYMIDMLSDCYGESTPINIKLGLYPPLTHTTVTAAELRQKHLR